MDQDEFSAALRAAVEREQEPAEVVESDSGEDESIEEKLARLEAEEEADAEAPEEEVEPESEDEPEETEPEAPAEEGLPAELAAYVERHGGVEQALRVALEAQSLIGRQGSELGELRQAVQALQAQVARPQYEVGDIEERIVDNPQAMAAWALQNEQEQIFEAAMAEWYEQDPRGAARFERTIEQEIFKSELAQTLQPAQAQQIQAVMVQAKRELVAQFPDADQILSSATDDELAGLDPAMVGQLRDQNPRAALEVVYRWVKSGRLAGESDQTAVRAHNAATKKDAAVVKSTSSTPAREEKTAMDLFKERMLAPAEYSVSHGLQQ